MGDSSFELIDGDKYTISHRQIVRWYLRYPLINVDQELKEYAKWNLERGGKKKTRRNQIRSIIRWLAIRHKKAASHVVRF